jgi:hypothetical protein
MVAATSHTTSSRRRHRPVVRHSPIDDDWWEEKAPHLRGQTASGGRRIPTAGGQSAPRIRLENLDLNTDFATSASSYPNKTMYTNILHQGARRATLTPNREQDQTGSSSGQVVHLARVSPHWGSLIIVARMLHCRGEQMVFQAAQAAGGSDRQHRSQ